MEIFYLALGILICMGGIALGSNWLVESAARIAKKFNISELVIGLTVVAFGTSAPEFAVSITGAVQDLGNISVGNIVGSNIFNLGFILGGCALIIPMKTSPPVVKRDGAFLLFGTILLCTFIPFLGQYWLDRYEGMVLFSLLFIYLGYLYFQRSNIVMEELPAEDARPLDGLLLFVGLVLVVAGAHFLVEFAVELAKIMGITEWVISVTIVAAGTSVPEVATSLTAVLKGRHGISAGNLIGSDIFNMYGVLGLASMIKPLHVDPSSVGSVFALFLMVFLTICFMRTGWVISRWEGAALVGIACIRWGYDLREVLLRQFGLTEQDVINWFRNFF